jgi:hypothetical protein
MAEIAAYLIFMLVAMAIGLAVIVAAVFCIGLCEAASWTWARVNAAQVRSVIAHR